MNILIFEDEKYNYDLLRRMIEDMFPDGNVMKPLTSVAEGKQFFAENKERVDLIIADIQLNDGLSFYALADAPCDVPIIFTSAYDEYALKAFEYNSLSYLLKPVDEDELRDAIRKARERLITDEQREEFFRLLASHSKYRERFFVKTFNGERVVNVSQVHYFVSEQKSTYAKLNDGTTYEIGQSLSSIEEELNPNQFMRVNRKYIVPASEVERFESLTNGKELLILRNEDAPEIVISRDNREKIHSWMRGQVN